MKVGVPKEMTAGERRVGLVPDGVTKLVAAKLELSIQAGAGSEAFFADDAYQKAGATIVPDAQGLFKGADAILKVQPPNLEEVAWMRAGALSISFLQPSTHADVVKALARQQVTAFSLELVPRISRAQSMDALSSQAGVSGYKAVLIAATRLPRFFPLLITAAGTVTPARVLVLGAGVAGLQAIATARRLGAVVEAYDVRPAVKEEVKSLGRAPVLVTKDMVTRMRPGSVIVDLAADSGGNVESTRAGEVTVVNGVTVDGTRNIPSTMPVHASQLFSRNVSALLLALVKDGKLNLDFNDDIVKGACLTHGGEVVHPRAKEVLEASKA